ncbi:MAG: hypothetical protein AUJ85_07835 [Elusimicrobia bacterium CG1_02_37_114]|nr:MAG: hypothetical protein AUJ85_07835 [Elusimicrobia bacterium CG1_02_37_114]PIV53510.1 MAG: hypothetical protein COS17_03455 [Elusimicrobia bacterium CG02_land_8_20_14_3_00_37_13]PIZ13412.1 MAG: hypothetical protein COY53_04895 [Elusimicrobia bacterium CG_4_10_14_0_8_um_filter_37_32]
MSVKIMVIDDSEAICQMCKKALENEAKVEVFTDPKEALEHFSTEFFDLALIDMRLPGSGMDGIEILNEIKKISNSTDTMLMTAFPSSSRITEEAARLGVYDFLFKPIEINNLRLRVKKCLEKRKLNEQITDLKKKLNEMK